MARHNKIFLAFGIPVIVVILLVAGGAGVVAAYENRILPGVSIGIADVGGEQHQEAERILAREVELLLSRKTKLYIGGELVAESSLQELGMDVPISVHIHKAAQYGRDGAGWDRFVNFIRGTVSVQIPIDPIIHDDVLHAYVQENFSEWVREPKSAFFQVDRTGSVELIQGESGMGVDTEQLSVDLKNAFGALEPRISILLRVEQPEITTAEATVVQNDVERVINSPLTLIAEDIKHNIDRKILSEWVTLEKRNGKVVSTVDRDSVVAYLEETISPMVNRDPQDARFEMNNGRAVIFEPPKNGIELQVAGSVDRIRQAVEVGRASVDLGTVTQAPDIATTADIERLGIRELIGVGESDFAGSPRNRIHNIRVGTSRFHGLLIAPGEEFAFNKNLGPVTAAAGYLPELVILHDSTVPQFGGGLCQVSTTAFRAAVYSGMEVTERHAHAYPVSYYGTPGFDSTIYPSRQWRDGVDLKFVNNTNHYVLIQARVEGTKNIFEFWGTSDGREVVVEGPYPYDRRPDGSTKATLRQKVYQEGELVFEKVFHSSYRSPALYPRVREAEKEREEEDTEEESSETVEVPPEPQEPAPPPEEPPSAPEQHEAGE